MSNCITNNNSKLKHISILQIINHNMSKKKKTTIIILQIINHNNMSIIINHMVKYHLITRVRQVKRVPCDEH